MNAIAYRAHHGFSNRGRIEVNDPEIGNRRLAMCVELVDEKQKLESFCQANCHLLKGKIIIYKQVEHWDIRPCEAVELEEMVGNYSPAEFIPKVAPLHPATPA